MAKKKMRIDQLADNQLAEVGFEDVQEASQNENDENYADYLAYLEKQKLENAG